MTQSRISQAATRLEEALARVDNARAKLVEDHRRANETEAERGSKGGNSARVMALINNHEKLREEVAETLRDLDALIEEIEGDAPNA